VQAIGGTKDEKLSPPQGVCRSIETIVGRGQKFKAFEASEEVAVLGPTHIAFSKHVPATWPPGDLASLESGQTSKDGYAVLVKGKPPKLKRTYQPLFAVKASTLVSVEIELDPAFEQLESWVAVGPPDRSKSVTLELGEEALTENVLLVCARHFGVHQIQCCMKDGDSILTLGDRCTKGSGKWTLAPATKDAVVTLVRSDKLADGESEEKKLAATVDKTGQAAVPISSLLNAVRSMEAMTSHAQSDLSVWSDVSQSARSDGEIAELPEAQTLGLVETKNVIRLSWTLHLVESTKAPPVRQCLPDTRLGDVARVVMEEAGLDPASCVVVLDGAEPQGDDAPNVMDETVGKLGQTDSGSLGISIHAGVKLVGRGGLHKIARGQTFDQLREQLGLPSSSRLGELRSHIVQDPDALVETSWRCGAELGAVRSAAVCTVSLEGAPAQERAKISFNVLATMRDVLQGLITQNLATSDGPVTDQHHLLWNDCVLPAAATLEMVLRLQRRGTSEEESSQITLAATVLGSETRVNVSAPESAKIQSGISRSYMVGVAKPETVTFATVKQVACLHFGMPHVCFGLSACLDLSDPDEPEEGTSFEEDDAVGEMVDEHGDDYDAATVVVPLALHEDECVSVTCELTESESGAVAKTVAMQYLPSMPFRRVRSYAKQAFAAESSHLDAEHGCVSVDSSSDWIELSIEDIDVDEDDFGSSMEDLGAEDAEVVKLIVPGTLRAEPGPMDGTPFVEPEPESDGEFEPEPEPEPEPELEAEPAEGIPPTSRRAEAAPEPEPEAQDDV
jgi:hypothetical protein